MKGCFVDSIPVPCTVFPVQRLQDGSVLVQSGTRNNDKDIIKTFSQVKDIKWQMASDLSGAFELREYACLGLQDS